MVVYLILWRKVQHARQYLIHLVVGVCFLPASGLSTPLSAHLNCVARAVAVFSCSYGVEILENGQALPMYGLNSTLYLALRLLPDLVASLEYLSGQMRMFGRGEEGVLAIIEKLIHSVEWDFCVKKQLHSAMFLDCH